MYEVRKKKLV